ncbi:MAG: hypothetical protein HY925_14520 [Elusimicrobia bacterium]|nr:hypothetical protein [Elusimicrobiota bacterium]
MKARRPETPVIDLPNARWAGETAVLFGPEKTGLTAGDLAYASEVLRIPTSSVQPSMNLAASVAVVCYQFGLKALTPALSRKRERGNGKRELIARVWTSIESLAEGVGWPNGERMRRLKAAVYRSNLSDADAGMALELLRRLTGRG